MKPHKGVIESSRYVIGFQYMNGDWNNTEAHKNRCISKMWCPQDTRFSEHFVRKGSIVGENELHWFPMRIRHSSFPRLTQMIQRLEVQKQQLEKDDILLDVYAPIRFIKVSMTKMDFAPYLLNFVFVRSTFSNLVKLKSNQLLFEPLRFVMHPAYDANYNCHNEVVYISDKVMADYRRVAESENRNVIFLRDLQYAIKPSQAVQITEGDFAGVVGRIKRVGGKRCVVLTVCDSQAAAIVDVHRDHLRLLTDEEARELRESITV